MSINHLIWERIFTDPEFGGLESVEKDRLGELYQHNSRAIYDESVLDDDIRIEELNTNRHNIQKDCVKSIDMSRYTIRECRGIRVIVPRTAEEVKEEPRREEEEPLIVVEWPPREVEEEPRREVEEEPRREVEEEPRREVEEEPRRVNWARILAELPPREEGQPRRIIRLRKKNWTFTSPPSLKVSSILSIVNILSTKFDNAEYKLYKEIYNNSIKEKENDPICYSYEVDSYLRRMSRDVTNSTFQYRFDLNYTEGLDECKIYPEHFFKASSSFNTLYEKLYTFGCRHDIDALKRLSPYIERVWDLIIKILQMHHEIAHEVIPKNPLRPTYHNMCDEMHATIHIHARYPPI